MDVIRRAEKIEPFIEMRPQAFPDQMRKTLRQLNRLLQGSIGCSQPTDLLPGFLVLLVLPPENQPRSLARSQPVSSLIPDGIARCEHA